MGPIWLLLGLLIGGAAGALCVRRVLADRAAAAEARGAEQAEQNSALGERNRELEQDKLRAEGDAKAEVVALKAQLQHERESAAEKIKLLTRAREDLVAQVKQSAGEALDARGDQLVKMLTAHLSTAQTQGGADLDKRQKAIEQVVSPLKDMMTRMDKTLSDVESDRKRSHAEIGERLRGVVEAEHALRNEAGALARALRQPHTRGRWGELHLRRLVEVAGMSGLCDFTEQAHVEGGDGRLLRPDMVVHLPGDRDVVVDSKSPLAPYLDACEAEEDAAREAHMKLYARGLRAHVKQLASKDYAAQFESAPDFVLLYLPGEHFFSAAVEADPALVEDALTGRVLIATPTTLVVMLRTIAHSWQQEKVAQEAQAIGALGRQLYERLATYLKHVDRVSKRLNSAVEAQNDAVGSLERMVLPATRRFPDLGALPAGAELQLPASIGQTARDVPAPESSAPPLPPGPGSQSADATRRAA
jgi:DNA recombination protein RmuC